MLDMLPRLSAALADRYVIERQIGSGGMATVYLARELKHDREVALKVLRPEIAAQLGAERFLKEIKITARLDHPHILTLIDSGESDGFLWYVQPYIRGESLRVRLLREKQLGVDDAINIARQIAGALEHAHHHGVIHRDIKPENILLHEGEAMVADFGIALALSEAADPRLTATGFSLGSPQYMSPEQATGERHLDGRSDVYALGAVLYEMLAGVAPHTGQTSQAIISKLLTERPTPLRAIRGTVPPAVESAVARALEKTPADRFPSAAAFAVALQGSAPVPRAEPASRRLRVALMALAAALALAAAYLLLRPSPTLAIGRSEQITAEPGLEIQPALSPDGQLVAYAAGTAGHMRIFIRPVAGGGGRTIPLSDDSTAVETHPRWSPDGSRLLFLTRGGAAVASAFGGASQPVVPPGGGNVQSAIWSPDGLEIGFVRSDTLLIVSTDGGTPRPIGGGEDLHSCDWAPRGKWIVCASQNSISTLPGTTFGNLAPSSILLFPVRGGEPIRVAEPPWSNQSPVFAPDGVRLFFISNRDGPRDVYVETLSSSGQPRGKPLRLSTGLGVTSISVSADGRRLAYAAYTARSNVWSIPIPAGAPVTTAGSTPVTRGNQVIESMRVSRDGRWLVYDSDLLGNANIYRMPLSGGPPEQLTTSTAEEFAPDLSPDGRFVAYHSWRTGTRDIEVKPLDGGPVEQVTQTRGQEAYPVWSPDGQALAFVDTDRPLRVFVTRRGLDGSWSAPVLLATPGLDPEWSPDGRSISYVKTGDFGVSGPLMVIPATGGRAREVVTPGNGIPAAGFARWSPDGRTLYFKAHDVRGAASFWSVSAQGGRARLLVRFDDPAWQSSRNDFTTDGKRLYFAVEDRQSDVFVADLLKR